MPMVTSHVGIAGKRGKDLGKGTSSKHQSSLISLRRLFGGNQQDLRSMLIAAGVGLTLGAIVLVVGYYIRGYAQGGGMQPLAAGPNGPSMTIVDPDSKRINTYWRVGMDKFRYFYTDSANGRMIDGGVFTSEQLLKRGVTIPGQIYMDQQQSSSNNELAARFKALRDHLN